MSFYDLSGPERKLKKDEITDAVVRSVAHNDVEYMAKEIENWENKDFYGRILQKAGRQP